MGESRGVLGWKKFCPIVPGPVRDVTLLLRNSQIFRRQPTNPPNLGCKAAYYGPPIPSEIAGKFPDRAKCEFIGQKLS